MPISITDDRPVAKIDPEKEYLSGEGSFPLVGGYASMAAQSLRITESSGPELADIMSMDAKISGSIRTIKDGVLSQGTQITATVQVDPEGSPEDVTDADIEMAFKVEDHCERCWRNLKGSRVELLRKMLDAMRYRTMLSEVVRSVADRGPDEGLYVLDRISVKDPGTWLFVRDPYGNVRGIEANTWASPSAMSVQSKIFPREKFLILPWLPQKSNPWGQGLLGETYNPWNMKIQLYPMYWNYLKRFGVPIVHASTPENAESRVPFASDGTALDTADIPATAALHKELLSFLRKNSDLITTPYGTVLNLLRSEGKGEAFQSAFDMLDREIVYAIHNTTLSMGVQGKRSNGTSDGQGQDMLGLVISYGKWVLKEMLYHDLWYPHVLFNFGPEVADRFTPEHSFGMTNPEDFSRNSNAITRMYAAQMITPEERTDALRFLGLTFGRRRRKSDPVAQLTTDPQSGGRPINVKKAVA